ncbi:MAG TPA: FtsX-like permease family protein [Steroidobacteraceae bacterium]|nr:FtsX-like permease family protein [Steroidobacteraceae bacterium]
MHWVPILCALRHNKVGATLIALQIALTLAVLCNALFIIQQRTAQSRRPSGVGDEASVFIISNRWVVNSDDLPAREQTDLAALRSLPEVADATVSNDHPLGGPVWSEAMLLNPDMPRSGVQSMVYMMDDHGLDTLGLRLVAGRNFSPADVVNRHGLADHAGGTLPGIIITQAAAKRLSATGSVLGHTVLIVPDGISTRIIGIVDQLMSTPFAGNAPFSQNSIILPYRWADAQIFYVVRARPGQLGAAMVAARSKLYDISTQRIITGMQTLSDSRLDAYRGDRGLAFLMEVVCAILLVVTAFGIVGLTSYWVAQRRRQIGIRRALGATRGAILRHFQSENLLISGAGVAVGVLLAIAANLWVVRSVALARLPFLYPLIGVAAMLLLGQLAVLWPALRASAVPPASAARSA